MFVNGCVSQPNLFMLDFFFWVCKKREIKHFNRPPQHIRHPQGPYNTRVERQARRPTDVPKTIFSSLQQFWTGYFFFFVLPYSIYLLPFDHQTMLQWRHSLNKIFHPPQNPPSRTASHEPQPIVPICVRFPEPLWPTVPRPDASRVVLQDVCNWERSEIILLV